MNHSFKRRIGGGCGVTPPEVSGKRVVVNAACKATVSDAEIFPIPPRSREPDFEANIRIASRLDHASNATERRKVLIPVSGGRGKLSGGNGFGCERRGRQRYRGKLLAIGGSDWTSKGDYWQSKGRELEKSRM